MARLILRLEPLAGSTTAPGQPGADECGQHTATERRQRLADQFATEAAPAHAPPPEPVTRRRVVNVAAPERMTVPTPLTRWSAAVAAAHDACFVVDVNGVVISISVAAVELLGCGDATVIGCHILDVLRLVDLETGAANPDYGARITPLAVLDQPGLSRSLLRVRHPDGSLVTLDSSSAPVHDVTGYPLGSVTFLAPIRSIVK